MNEYLSQLYDWISRTDNTFSSRKSRDEFVSKMMNEDDYNTQIYNWVNSKDASFSSKYTTDQFKAKTLANYTPLKKKDESELTSQEVATESITKEEPPVTLSDASKSEFDYESFIDKDEEFALPELEDQLSGKGYSIEKTGLGDALLVTDNITQEQVEIDLQPISWFGNKKYKEEEISKVRKLIETPTDARRKALSANQLEVYSEDRLVYIDNLKRLYPDISFEYIDDPTRGGLLKITKGSSVGKFPMSVGTGNDAKQFADINSFLYQNITEDEASSIIKRQEVDEYKKIVEEYSKIDRTIDISMESAETDFYSKDYFKGLFKALEQSGISVPQEAKQELEKGTVTRQEYRGNNPVTIEVDMNKSMIDSGVQKYFGSNPEVLAKINQYNLSGTVSVRKSKIDRAKKLAIEDFLDKSPDRESTKEILRRVNKDASEQQLDIETNLTMARSHLTKMVSSVKQSAEEIASKYPNLKVEVIEDEKGNLVDIISSEPVKEVDDLKKGIKDAFDVYTSLVYKSKYDYDKIASKAETTGQYIELANKSYDLFDTAMADINNALTQMAGSFTVMQTLAEGAIEDATGVTGISLTPAGIGVSSESKMKSVREQMAESREKLDKAYKTERTYQEAIKEGSKFEFGTRQFAAQSTNIALAIATSGAGLAANMSKAAISSLVATQFGVTSAGQKYDELTTRQEISSIAEKAKKDLESVKGIIPDDEYFAQMYELERAIEDGKITPWKKTLAVTGVGLIEGLVMKYIGTVPNSMKVLKDLKVKPTQFMDDILRSNYKATLNAFKEFGKRTGGEIIEETAIATLSQVNDYAFLGDQIDLSSLDDVAVTAIITSGAMNTPSMAYSTILTQTNVNRYKSKIESLTGEITTLRDMLSDPDLTNIQRLSIHNNISNIISQVADQTTNMEGDALLLGADNIKEMMTLSGVRNSMLKKAGVENDDSYDVANAKIDTYLKGVDQKEGKKFVDQMKYIDGRRNDILKSINYEGAVERVFGEKGKEIAKDLDPSLTPQQKYVEVYGQVRQEINDNALKEFKDAIQEQETRDIPDAQRAEGVQEVEGEVREPIVQEKRQEIEQRRQGELFNAPNEMLIAPMISDGKGGFVDNPELAKAKEVKDKINAKYDAELDDLDTEQATGEEAVPGQKTIISDIEVTFPTEQEDTQRKETRTTNEYIDESVSKLEVEDTDQLSKDLEGVFGILTGENPLNKALTEEENQQLNQKAQQWLKDKGYNPRMLTGKYNQGENSFFVPGLTKADAIAFAKEFNQESVAHSDGLLYQDGRVNPRDKAKDNFTLQDYTPDSNFVSIVQTNEGPKTFNIGYDFETTITPEETKIQAEVQQLTELLKSPDQRKQVENAEKALKAVAPDVEIVVHESEQAYAEATGETGRKQKTAGTYDETIVDGKVKKVIHINPEKANERTVAHEVFHAILLSMVKTDAKAQRITEAMMKAVAKVASPELKAYLDEFASNYDENIRAEEKLAELVGKLASEYSSLPKPTQNIIKRWLDRLAKMFGLKPFTDEQVIDVLNTIAGKVARGEAITKQDVSSITSGSFNTDIKPITRKLKQFVGEKANITADQKSSKKKAQDMIKKGMDPLRIKQQTGFEVGVDGKLRLELDASKSKEIGPGLRHSFGQTTVSEVLEFPDLLKAYPFISDIPIFFNDGFPSDGLYDGVRIMMNSASIKENGNGDYLGTLLHEIQHVIQIQEGFTGGANPSTIRDEVKKAVRNLNNKAINAIQTQVEKLTGIRPELTITEGDRKELTEVYENNEAALIDMLSRHTVEDVDAVVKVIRNADNSYYAVENLMEEFGMPNDEAVLLNGIHGVFDMKLYESLSGEVEARNVQNRRTMTEAERRNSLAAETETISQLMSVEDGGKFINVPIKRSEQIRRKQVANYDNVIKTAKENNISDAAIRQYLSENGMTLNEADAVVKNYNDRIRKIRQKKEGLFTKDNKVLKTLDSIRRYVSSGKGQRPKSMQVGQEDKQGFIDSQSKAAMYEFRRLEKAIKGYKGDVNALKSNLEAYMRGDKSVSLPENIQKIAFKMRTHIDGLSKMLVETGAVSDVAFDDLTTAQKKDLIKQFKTEEEARKNYTTSKENILNNIGSYMTRSYEVFNNENWKEQVTDEVLQNAKNHLRDSMRKKAANEASKTNRPVDVVLEEMVDDQVNKLLDRESAKEYVSNANVSSKNIGVLKRRVDIPAPLRALMGEYTDTAKNYIVTVNKIATLAAQQNFLNEMKLAGMDVFFFEKPTGNFKARIAAEGSKTMDPLNGLYTTPEILKALKGGDVYGFNLGPIQPLFEGYLKAVGAVKYNKTILSPGTHAKNFLGNMYFMLANGHIDPKDWYKSTKAIAADFGVITNEEAEAKMLEYVEAGVISQSVNLRDLKAMFSGDISSEQQFEDKMKERFNNPKWSKIKEKPEQWYQAEDDFFKIIAYESNKARYSKAFHNKPFDQLNDTQKKEVLDRAIEVTKNTLPNYSRLPEIRKLMRAIPLAGTFISFHIEAIRTAYNTIHIAATEIKDPRTREIGIKRLSGIFAMIGLKAFVLSSIGIGDDDDEVKESTRRFLPPWSTNSEVVIESVKDGKIIYRDLSASDPWGVVDRAMNGFMSGEDTLDGFIEATKEVVGPFFDEDILIGAINRANEKTNKALPLSENLEIWLKELYGALEPGAVTSAIKISKSENTKNEIVGQISGYKSREIDVVKTIGFKFRDVRSYPDGTIFAVTKKYSTAFRKFKEGEATAQEVQDAYNESNQSYKRIMSDVLKDYTAAIKIDADMFEIYQKMKDAGFSKYEIDHISSGMIPELSRNREAVKANKFKSVF